MSPEEVLKLLTDGNTEFVADTQRLSVEGGASIEGQAPMATILACSDSRVPVESLFGRGIGGVFVVRVAGNMAFGRAVLGSIEYGTLLLKTPLLVVLGHHHCGAVKAAIDVDLGTLPSGRTAEVVEKIRPAVAHARAAGKEGEDLWRGAVSQNVRNSIEKLKRECPEIADRAKTGKLGIRGAVYSIEDRRVHWLARD